MWEAVRRNIEVVYRKRSGQDIDNRIKSLLWRKRKKKYNEQDLNFGSDVNLLRTSAGKTSQIGNEKSETNPKYRLLLSAGIERKRNMASTALFFITLLSFYILSLSIYYPTI